MNKARASRLAGKCIGWILGAGSFVVVAYLAWYRVPRQLLRWGSEAWWHWFFVAFLSLILFLAPTLTIVGSRSLVAAAGMSARRYLSTTCGYLGTVATCVLMLWAFTERPGWWVSWHWGLWVAISIGAAVLSAAGWMFLTVQEVRQAKARETFTREWRFNHGDKSSPPAVGIAMSGGGIRSAAFNIGVLQALHERRILQTVDVMSAVSGGSYAMSWYLLQPFYAARAAAREHTKFDLDAIIDEMFQPAGRFQAHLSRNPSMADYIDVAIGAAFDSTLFQPLRAFVASMGLGASGQYNRMGAVREGYRERIQELFQGLPTSQATDEIGNLISMSERQELNLESSDVSRVTPVRYRELAEFLLGTRLPFFIFNAAVLVERPYRHMLWPTAFEFTADDLGSDVCGYRRWDELRHLDVSEAREEQTRAGGWRGYRDSLRRRGDARPNRWIFMVNLASAISGAAVGLSYFDPRKPLRRMRLATWTPFVGNLDLGYLFPREIWEGKGALYLSDGGHSENLGAYALIKRKCRTIIIVDADHEPAVPYAFGSYSKLKERLAKEMNMILTISDIDAYLDATRRIGKPTAPAAAVMRGTVTPMNGDPAAAQISVIYVKLVLNRERLDTYPAEVSGYARENAAFPQDPTFPPIFTSQQFIAYRELGHHVAATLDEIVRVAAV
jgi:hypothetical protein